MLANVSIENLTFIYLLTSLGVVAFLFSSVGHGGASGYLAVMSIFALSPIFAKNNALVLNCFVSLISFCFFRQSTSFNKKLILHLLFASIPCAFLGSKIIVDQRIMKIILAICLMVSVVYINGFFKSKIGEQKYFNPVLCLIIGAIIGFLSGILGIGGGILLSPILIILGWSSPRESAAISALFIFFNSLAGVLGALSNSTSAFVIDWYLALFVLFGAISGSYLGSNTFSNQKIKWILSSILVFASIKLVI